MCSRNRRQVVTFFARTWSSKSAAYCRRRRSRSSPPGNTPTALRAASRSSSLARCSISWPQTATQCTGTWGGSVCFPSKHGTHTPPGWHSATAAKTLACSIAPKLLRDHYQRGFIRAPPPGTQRHPASRQGEQCATEPSSHELGPLGRWRTAGAAASHCRHGSARRRRRCGQGSATAAWH